MEYLLAVCSLALIIVVVMSGDVHDDSFNAFAGAMLRGMSVTMLVLSFAIAFDIIDIESKYYGYVELQNQIAYATVFGLGAVTLAILSNFTTRKR